MKVTFLGFGLKAFFFSGSGNFTWLASAIFLLGRMASGRLCRATTNTMQCPGNTGQLRVFRRRVTRLWRSVLVRRSQRAQVGWDRLNPLLSRWIPAPHVLHPYPDKRFDAIHPR